MKRMRRLVLLTLVCAMLTSMCIGCGQTPSSSEETTLIKQKRLKQHKPHPKQLALPSPKMC